MEIKPGCPPPTVSSRLEDPGSRRPIGNRDLQLDLTRRNRGRDTRWRRLLANKIYTRRLLSRARGRRVLELGPGFNTYHRQLSKRFNVLHGIDLNPEACQRAERLGYQTECSEIRDLTDVYQRNTFDVVFSRHVLEHLEHPEETVASMARVLVPGGWALHEMPMPPYFEPAHIAELYPHEWARCFQRAGFTVYELKRLRFLGIDYFHVKARIGNHIEQGVPGPWWHLLDVPRAEQLADTMGQPQGGP